MKKINVKQLLLMMFTFMVFFIVIGWNHPVQAISIPLQFDKVNEEEQPLSGAEFLLKGSGLENGITATSGQNGRVIFSQGIGPGFYTLTETNAPIGYVTSPGAITVELRQVEGGGGKFFFGSTPQENFKFTNRKIRYPITLTKVDSSNNSKFLQGAVFELYQNMNGQIPDIKIGEYITDENGKITVDVPEGSYYFVEKTPPAGYRLVGDSRTTDVFVGMNAPQGSITITNEIIPVSPGSGSSNKPEREKPEKEKPQEPIIKKEEPVAVIVPPVIPEPVIEPKPQITAEEIVVPIVEKREQPIKSLPRTNGITPFIFITLGMIGMGGGFIMKRKK